MKRWRDPGTELICTQICDTGYPDDVTRIGDAEQERGDQSSALFGTIDSFDRLDRAADLAFKDIDHLQPRFLLADGSAEERLELTVRLIAFPKLDKFFGQPVADIGCALFERGSRGVALT